MTPPAPLGEDYGYCFRGDGTQPAPAPSKWAQLRRGKALLPELQRFQACHHNTRRENKAPGVSVHVGERSAWFGGTLYRCGSVWVCPVCARLVADRRRDEVQTAVDNAVRRGWGVILVTLTFPHGAGDVLADTLEKFSKAQKLFKSGRAAASLRAGMGYQGECRTLEVTHGNNGWHPHAHSLWFLDRQPSQEELTAHAGALFDKWRAACLSAGLPEPSREHGVDVRGARYAAEYVAKWGFSMEIAGGSSKRGKLGSRTPWQLLADATDGDPRAAWLWREFALAFFGKRQLFWSRRKVSGQWVSIRTELELAPELTEQEEMDLLDSESRLVALLDFDTWYCVRKADAQEAVLHYAQHDERELFALLNHLRSTVPMEHGRPPGPREDWQG